MTKIPEVRKKRAIDAYQGMQVGLAQIHGQIDQERKELEKAPKNFFEAFCSGFLHPFKDQVSKYQKVYYNFVYDVQIYDRLLLLTDCLLQFMGSQSTTMFNNHKVINDYCIDYIDKNFIKNINYLMNSKINDIANILAFEEKVKICFGDCKKSPASIEYKQYEYKLLNDK